MLFESSWKESFTFYERVYDTNLKKSIKREINNKYEWYEPASTGIYSDLLNNNIKLKKVQNSNPKEGRDKHGFIDPLYGNIRNNYWSNDKYNKKPRVWYLDIETRVGTSYKNPDTAGIEEIKIKKQNKISELNISVKDLQEKLYNGGEENFEYFNEKTGKWEELKNSKYFERNKGFPKSEKALEPISLIQIFDSELNKVYIFALREWKHILDYKLEYELEYIVCENELDLINKYISFFKKCDPLIIYAWNGNNFDFPYIYNRLKNLGLNTNLLSNYGDVSLKEEIWFGEVKLKFNANGHHFIDLMEVYKNFVFAPRSSYSLDNISEIELKEKKVPHTEYATFDDFYTGKYILPSNPTEYQKSTKIYQEALKGNTEEVKELAHSEFCFYGYKDPLLIKKIDDKLNFTALLIMISQKMGVLLSDATGTVKPWSQYISNRSYQNNKIIPPKSNNEASNVVGGYVRDPQKGKHKWVLSADVNSMYPLLSMVSFNMSPETFVPKHELPSDIREIVLTYFNDQNEQNRLELSEDIWSKTSELLNKYNYSLGINGAVFKNDKLGMIPEMVQEIYNSRKKAKKQMLEFQKLKVLVKDILHD